MSSNIFEKIIDKHTVAFKEAVTADIRAFLAGSIEKAPKAAKKTKKTTATAAKPKAAKKERKPRGAKVDVTEAVRDIVAKVASHPDGVKGEIVRAELKLEKAVWNKAIKAAVAQKSLTTKGSKRGMTYHFKAAKVKAGKPETVAEAAE